MRKFGKFFIGLIVLLSIVACIFYFMPKYSAESIAPDYTMELSELNVAFDKNEAAASTKYVGKVIAIEGVIQEKSRDQEQASVLLLSNTKNGQPLVLCTMENSESDKVSKLDIGDNVKLKGQCTGKLLEVVMKNGILLD